MSKLPLGHENLTVHDIITIFSVLEKVNINRRQLKNDIFRRLNAEEVNQVSGGVSIQATVRYDGQLQNVRADMKRGYEDSLLNRLKKSMGL